MAESPLQHNLQSTVCGRESTKMRCDVDAHFKEATKKRIRIEQQDGASQSESEPPLAFGASKSNHVSVLPSGFTSLITI